MKNKISIFLGLCACILYLGAHVENTVPVNFVYPEDWPKPVYNFEENPLTEEGIALGRLLFYDRILSGDETISCGDCHLSYSNFAHTDHTLSHGINESIGDRNSLALVNLAWTKNFMWDGAAHYLDQQALAPITSSKEMGSNLALVLQRLNNSEEYSEKFKTAFETEKITGEYFLKALAQFQLSLVSYNTKYDKVKKGEESFNEEEQRGYHLFKKHCNSCHQEPLFTTSGFANNGLKPDPKLNDGGRIRVTRNPEDSLKFKIPTLRNINYSFPYMHDGRFMTTMDVLNHYSEEIFQSPSLDEKLKKGIRLEENEKHDLLAFLYTLDDQEFLYHKKHIYPRNLKSK